ncbi:MAG: ribosome maturation factor RimM [Clostridia bacterium]|nr:ribosome maturation factor RimM [Clostridia bacterium]MDD4386621.1 ribosome maturation factor RimM [Clostridia bacterium]
MDSIKIGQIVNTHGLKGEIKIYPYTDDIEDIAKFKKIYLDPELKLEYIVRDSKIIKNMIVFKLAGIDTLEQTKNLMQKYIYTKKVKIKEENTYYIEDLINLDIYTVDDLNDFSKALYFGKLVNVFNSGASDVYEVKTEIQTVYLPAIKDVILKISLEEGKVYVKIMEGLI